MVDNIRPTPPILPAAPTAPTAASPVVAPTVAGDRLARGSAPPLLEADLRLTMTGGATASGNGMIKVDHRIVERFATHVMNNPRDFRDIKVTFDPATGAYTTTGKLVWARVGLPFKADTRTTIVDGQIALTFENIRFASASLSFGVPGFIGKRVLETIHRQFDDTRVRVEVDASHLRLLLEPASLLHEIGALPPYFGLDAARTTLALANQPNGDIHVAIASETPGLLIGATPRSDVSVALDEKALTAVLAKVLASDYALETLTLTVNGLKTSGQVEYKPISDVLNGFQALVVLLSLGGGRGVPHNLRVAKSMGPLALDVALDGKVLVIEPDVHLALKPLAEVLIRAGIPSTTEAGKLRVDLQDVANRQGVGLESLDLGVAGAQVKLHLDVDALLRPKFR